MSGLAVIDLETTGIHHGYHHRVVELGVVLLDEEFRFEGTWTTLVNPERDVGDSSEIHGLRSRHLAHAPTFAEIAPDLLHVLNTRSLVAHNARFDLGFLNYEFDRAGVVVERYDASCTLLLAQACGLPTRLGDLAAALAVDQRRAHEALADAEVTAAVLTSLIRKGLVIADGMSAPFVAPPSRPPCNRCVSRTAPAPSRGDQFVAALAAQLSYLPTAAVDAPVEAVLAYVDVLDRALEDRILTGAEIEELLSLAHSWGLTNSDLADIHRSYLTSLIAVALADEVITEHELADLQRVADLLAIDPDALDRLIAVAASAVRGRTPRRVANGAAEVPPLEATPVVAAHELTGKSVCFTGACVCVLNGSAITRIEAELLAARNGLIVAPRVTKSLDVLVVADPDTRSGKATKARTYGTRIIAERMFWPSIGVCVD